MLIILFLVFCYMSGLLYRMGGMGNEGRLKYPQMPAWFFDTKARDIGCAVIGFCTIKFVIGIQAPWYIHLISGLLLFGALTTYWDFIFGYDNFFAHGLACGLAYAPYAIYNADLNHGFVIRVILLSVSIGIWSLVEGDDTFEEFGRGYLIQLTMLCFFI